MIFQSGACSEIISNRYANNLKKIKKSIVELALNPFFSYFPDTSLFTLQSHTAEKEEACFKYSSIFQTAVPILRFFFKATIRNRCRQNWSFLQQSKIVLQNVKFPFFKFYFFIFETQFWKKTDLVFPLKLSDMLEFWLYNPQKKSNFGKF